MKNFKTLDELGFESQPCFLQIRKKSSEFFNEVKPQSKQNRFAKKQNKHDRSEFFERAKKDAKSQLLKWIRGGLQKSRKYKL